MANIVYIGTSLDGYIADKQGGLDWLNSIPNPEQDDFGFANFMNRIDAVVMGRITFEVVCGFDCPWPYSKPVFVLSQTLNSIPEAFQDKAELVSGSLQTVLAQLHDRGYWNLYIDGGRTIQEFFRQDLVDEMIISTLPILLGGGVPLFGELAQPLSFQYLKTDVYLNALVKSHYRRIR